MADRQQILARALARQQGEAVLEPNNPSWRDRLRWGIEDALTSLGASKTTSQRYGDQLAGTSSSGIAAADLVPILSNALSADEGKRAYDRGDYLGAGIGAIGAIPIPAGKPVAAAASRQTVRGALDMSPSARLGRARAGGFFTDLPVYHGSGEAFPAFRAGDTLRDPMVSPGVSVALDPAVANEFAVRGDNATASPNVYKMYHRADRPASLSLTGSESHAEVVGALHDAFDSGRDAVMLRNYTTPDGLSGQNIIIVKDPSQLRSVNAVFDPAKRNSSDLLAGLAGAGAVGAGGAALFGGASNAEAGQDDRRRMIMQRLLEQREE